MALSKNQMIVLGLAVIIVIAAAVAASVLMKNNERDTNPNGILGMYEIVSYTQYGTSDSTSSEKQWEWYETGCGQYEGEKIRIDSYKDGIIKATCFLEGEYEIIGYYDPDTKAFGYASYYDYAPGERHNVIDVLHGSIEGNTMYLYGYTMSADSTSNIMYTFNFVFVKEGQKATMKEFKNVLVDNDFVCKAAYLTYLKGGNPEIVVDGVDYYNYNLSSGSYTGGKVYSNGVYALDITDKDGKIAYRGTATTVFQDATNTYLRGICATSNGVPYISWICIEGDQMCVIDNGIEEVGGNYNTYTYRLTSGEAIKKYDIYDASGKTMKYSNTLTSKNKIIEMEGIFKFSNRLGESFTIPAAIESKYYLVNFWPTTDYVSYNDIYNMGSTYYGDVVGHIGNNGEMILFGFQFSVAGDVAVQVTKLKPYQ